MYRTLVFDMQGSLIHSEELLSASLRSVLFRHGLEMPDGRTMRLYRILSPYSFVKEYYDLSPELADAMAREIRAERDALYGQLARPYEGAADTLAALRGRGLRLYAVSRLSVADAKTVLEGAGLLELLDGVYQKPVRGSVLELLASGRSLIIEETLYVGDGIDAMDEAERAGVDFLPCSYGYGFEPGGRVRLPVPVLDDIHELPALLEGLA